MYMCESRLYNEQCQYITNSNNTNSPSGHCHVLEPFDCSLIHVSKSSSWHALEQKLPIFLQALYRRQKPRHEHVVSISSSEKLSPSASAMTATMTLTMCFDE